MRDAHRDEWEERHRRGGVATAPSPFVASALDLIVRRHAAAGETCGHRAAGDARREPTMVEPRALDVACGAGRHALLLAARGYHVLAFDFARPALVALRAAAARVGAQGRIDVVAADATSWPVRPASFDIVVVVDFLERALFPDLRAAVAPGGVLVMETFMVGQERHGHPRNPAYLLRPGELRDACRGWTVLLAHEGESTAGAAACRAGIVAQRPREARFGERTRPRDVDSTEPFGSYPRR